MAKTILTVDDSASMRQMIKLTLSGAGYNVIEAGDGTQGLSTARGNAVDMVLTDLNMPGMDGVQLIRELRKLSTYTGVPIVLLTTESDAERKQQAKAAGATGWITKPFQPEQLLSVTRKVLGQ
ncbi:MAG: Phosphate regulon transcriptional regulatory protein PhoB [Xanthobacteraceae bacterium]|jgi:two-component system chemotaxis response regulator CheY|nr:Phosphate regulon transcriptional regulatory protein PhoB [Xanthobacteraceae bacterium]